MTNVGFTAIALSLENTEQAFSCMPKLLHYFCFSMTFNSSNLASVAF